MVKAYALAGINPHAEKLSPLQKALRVVSSAEARKNYFDRAQKYEQSELKREQAGALGDAVSKLKSDHKDKLAAKDEDYQTKSADLVEQQKQEVSDLKQSWKERQADRSEALNELIGMPERDKQQALDRTSLREEYLDALYLRLQMREEAEAEREYAHEQDNARDYDGHDPS